MRTGGALLVGLLGSSVVAHGASSLQPEGSLLETGATLTQKEHSMRFRMQKALKSKAKAKHETD